MEDEIVRLKRHILRSKFAIFGIVLFLAFLTLAFIALFQMATSQEEIKTKARASDTNNKSMQSNYQSMQSNLYNECANSNSIGNNNLTNWNSVPCIYDTLVKGSCTEFGMFENIDFYCPRSEEPDKFRAIRAVDKDPTRPCMPPGELQNYAFTECNCPYGYGGSGAKCYSVCGEKTTCEKGTICAKHRDLEYDKYHEGRICMDPNRPNDPTCGNDPSCTTYADPNAVFQDEYFKNCYEQVTFKCRPNGRDIRMSSMEESALGNRCFMTTTWKRIMYHNCGCYRRISKSDLYPTKYDLNPITQYPTLPPITTLPLKPIQVTP